MTATRNPSRNPARDAWTTHGVIMPAPQLVWIDPAIRLEQIAAGTEIHPGCRLVGAETSIGPGCVLGKEGPLTLEDCQLQREVRLGGGYASGATFLTGVTLGADMHIRPGTLLEEQVSGGHAVGLKQTLLFPFVATGSLINFCDCLMTGGTGRHHHSEVGSSYVHFNFTPNQDKATPSLLGDVPHGVLLDQPPIFLGGQGGLVGPARVAFGTVIAAGTIFRGDQLESGRLVYGQRREGERPITPGVYVNARRLVQNNLRYIGNVHALYHWYTHVRVQFLQQDTFGAACLRGAQRCLTTVLRERIHRLGDLASRFAAAPAGGGTAEERAYQHAFAANWPALEPRLTFDKTSHAGEADRTSLLRALSELEPSTPYLDALALLDPATRKGATNWLQASVDAALSVAD